MRKLLNRITAFVSSAVIMTSAVISTAPAFAADETNVTERTVSFNVFGEGITPGRKTNAEEFQTYKTTADVITIPNGTFERDDYSFNGWTVDGVYGYKNGDAIILRDMPENVVVEPLWVADSSDSYHTVSYEVSYNGEALEMPEWLPEIPREYVPGQLISPDMTEIQIDEAFSRGWFMGDLFIDYNQRIVMPDHDVVLTPRWIKRLSFTFLAGDVDRLVGNTEFTFRKNEGSSTELADADRFSRIGFNLVGWTSSYDGETYKPGLTVKVPSESVTFTAVWEPKSYNVVFKSGVSGITNQKVPGITDTAIVCPDMERAGYTLTAWKYTDPTTKESTDYAPGQEFIIPGALPGAGIVLEAVWAEGSVPVTSTEPAKTTEAFTTETTAATKPAASETTAPKSTEPAVSETTAAKTTEPAASETTAATDEMVECEVCHKIVKRSDCVVSPIGVLLCPDCKKTGAGGTTAPRPTEAETTETTAAVPTDVAGDANCDGVVTVADAVAILQYLANSAKYPLSEQGKKNADVDGTAGVSGLDALVIQKYDAKVIDKIG